jgi:uncharacterized protein YhfF
VDSLLELTNIAQAPMSWVKIHVIDSDFSQSAEELLLRDGRGDLSLRPVWKDDSASLSF